MPVARRWVSAVAILFASVTVAGVLASVPSSAAPITPTLVLGKPSLGEFQPVRGGGFLVWQQNSEGKPNHYNVFARPDGGGAKFRINSKMTQGAGGGIIGDLLAYQQFGGRTSNIEFYNLTKHQRWALPPTVNTRQWEYWPRFSGHTLLFGRLLGNGLREVVLYNLKSHGSRILDRTKDPKSFLAPGQVHGDWAVWDRCGPKGRCSVTRYHVPDHKRIVLFNPQFSERVASVSPEGIVYFVRSGVPCGRGVTLMRRDLDGTTKVLWRLNTGDDVSGTFLYVGPDGKRTLYFDDRACGQPAGSDVWRIDNPDNITLSVVAEGDGHGTVTSVPAGIDCGTSCTSQYGPGTQVTLTATPDGNSVFGQWGGACSGSQTSCVVTMDQSKSVTATFVATQGLTVIRVGNGHGRVTSDPPGIDCGSDCSETYPQGTQVTLTERPDVSSTFGGWGGACTGNTGTCTLTMDSSKSLTATFTLKHPKLTVTRTGQGSVTSQPGGIACPSECSARYDYGTHVSLKAHPDTGWHFVKWTGACRRQSCALDMTADVSVRAVFAQNP